MNLDVVLNDLKTISQKICKTGLLTNIIDDKNVFILDDLDNENIIKTYPAIIIIPENDSDIFGSNLNEEVIFNVSIYFIIETGNGVNSVINNTLRQKISTLKLRDLFVEDMSKNYRQVCSNTSDINYGWTDIRNLTGGQYSNATALIKGRFINFDLIDYQG